MRMWCDQCGRHGNEADMIEVGGECVMDDCTGTIHVYVDRLDAYDLTEIDDDATLLAVAKDLLDQLHQARYEAAKPAEPITKARDIQTAAYDALAAVGERIVEEPFPLNGICPHCDNENFEVFETGYDRTTSIDLEFGDGNEDDDEPPQTFTIAYGLTSGWSDFSENGDIEVCNCTECGHIYAMPEEFEWN